MPAAAADARILTGRNGTVGDMTTNVPAESDDRIHLIVLFGGEGVFMTELVGPGRVLLQSLKRSTGGKHAGGQA